MTIAADKRTKFIPLGNDGNAIIKYSSKTYVYQLFLLVMVIKNHIKAQTNLHEKKVFPEKG
jgi:hypothetical protein